MRSRPASSVTWVNEFESFTTIHYPLSNPPSNSLVYKINPSYHFINNTASTSLYHGGVRFLHSICSCYSTILCWNLITFIVVNYLHYLSIISETENRLPPHHAWNVYIRYFGIYCSRAYNFSHAKGTSLRSPILWGNAARKLWNMQIPRLFLYIWVCGNV